MVKQLSFILCMIIFFVTSILAQNNTYVLVENINKTNFNITAEKYFSKIGENRSYEDISELSERLYDSFQLLKKSKAFRKEKWQDLRLRKKYFLIKEVSDKSISINYYKHNAYGSKINNYKINLKEAKITLNSSIYTRNGCPRF